MKPVVQTDDCLAACVASIIEVDLEDLPDIPCDAEARFERWADWLREEGWELELHDAAPADGNVWIGIFGNARAIRRAVANLLQHRDEEDDGLPTHAVVCVGSSVIWNPWGVYVPTHELGDLVACLSLRRTT
jgi:hypothetical protein